jgi:hypothetical protein
MGKNSGSGSGMNNHRIILPSAQKSFFWVKILKFFDADLGSGNRDGNNLDPLDPGWRKVGSGIRDKHPGSATLVPRNLFPSYG